MLAGHKNIFFVFWKMKNEKMKNVKSKNIVTEIFLMYVLCVDCVLMSGHLYEVIMGAA